MHMRGTVAFLMILGTGNAIACSCMFPGPPCQAAWKAESVFRARVVDIAASPAGAYDPKKIEWTPVRVSLFIEERLLGPQTAKTTVEVWTGRGGGDCGYAFERGVTYVVYAGKAQDGRLTTGICSRTRPESEAAEDLAYFRSLETRKETAEISGTVQTLKPGAYGGRTAVPLAGARVTLTGGGTVKSTTADEAGTFRFGGLPAGKYKVAPSADGYSEVTSWPEIDLHAKGCFEAPLWLSVDRRIKGRVTAAGTPVANLDLELVPMRPRSEGELPFSAHQAKTGDDGSYEFKNVDEGDYYLGYGISRDVAAKSKYPRWMYPGTSDAKAAVPIRVHGPASTQTLNLEMPEAAEPRIIAGRVMMPDGTPANKLMILSAPVYVPFNSTVTATTDADGRFELIVPDRTSIRIHAWTNNSLWCDVVVPATGEAEPIRMVLHGGKYTDPGQEILKRWREGAGLP